MITFSIALAVLILGYFTYGKLVERLFGANDKNPVPASTLADGVDYVALPTWKAFMIQFLNIAGLGPIFGAIMGAKFGTSSYLWIVFGTIFGGAVHDYFSGMLSLRNKGASLPVIVGKYLGKGLQNVFTVFAIILLVLLGCVFVSQPADILARLTPDTLDLNFWLVAIFVYYFAATLFPIDKLIGNFYPILGGVLLFMAVGILVVLFWNQPDLPEMWNGFGTKYESNSIFPMMFISIACGAVSGFHGTQSPMMARCVKSEKKGRLVFYGAMVCEGIVALIWAAAATAYYQENGAGDSAALVTMNISKEWLGGIGGLVAIIGVVAAPITSGDTALRSARLVVADTLGFTQKGIINRLIISIPLFVITLLVLMTSCQHSEGFAKIWRYFAGSNQLLAAFTFWAATVYLCKVGKNYAITLIPALFMTMVVSTYIMISPECFEQPWYISYPAAALLTLNFLLVLLRWKYHYNMKFPKKTRQKPDKTILQ